MNEKQTKIFEAYKNICSFTYEISEAKSQEDFLDRLHELRKAIRNMQALECRGVEQHEFHLGLRDFEFDELMKEIQLFVDGE
jgi:hypothetical protein